MFKSVLKLEIDLKHESDPNAIISEICDLVYSAKGVTGCSISELHSNFQSKDLPPAPKFQELDVTLAELPYELDLAIGNFEKLQKKYWKVGAQDDEADAEFHYIITDAINNKGIDWEKLNWQLCEKSDEQRGMVLEAQPLLTEAAKEVYDAVSKYRNSRQVVNKLEQYAWRS